MKYFSVILFFCMPLAWANSHSLTVVLDWYLNPNHSPLLIAEQKGFFKKEGLSVKLIAPSNPEDGPKFVAMHRADMAITYQPSLMIQVDHQLPVMRIGTLINQPLNALVVLKKSGIQSIEHLKGRKIAYSAHSTDSAMLKAMLKSKGLMLKDVTLIHVHYNLMQALLTDQVSAAMGMMRNVEVVEMERLGYAVRSFYPEDYGFPRYDELILIVNKDRKERADLQAFLKALQKGVLYLKAHPEASWQILSQHYSEMDTPLNKAIFFKTLSAFDSNPAALDKNRYEKLAQYMYQNHLIDQQPSLATYAR
jgi:putative hydroxymethylpyrimidine transport system substrate-binding protein